MSASHFAAAHDSVILATDVPVVTKGSQGKLISKPAVHQAPVPPVDSARITSGSSSPRVLSIAPVAPPPSAVASIPLVESAVSSSKQPLSSPSSDLMALLKLGGNKSGVATPVPGTAGSVAPASSKSTVSSGKGSADSPVPSSDLLAILKSGAKKPSSIQSVALSTAHCASIVPSSDHSAHSSGNVATVGPSPAQNPMFPFPPHLPPQHPMEYGMMMPVHPMFMGMMPAMQPAFYPAGVPVAPSASRPEASSKVCLLRLFVSSF